MLASRPNLRRFAGTSALLLTERGVRMAIGLIVGILIARHLGAADFGQLSYVIAIGSFLQPVAVFGMDVVGLRQLAAHPDRRAETVAGILTVRSLFGVISLAGTVSAVLLLDGPARAWLAIPVALATLLQASDAFDGYFQAIVDQRWSVAARLTSLAAATSGRLLLISCDAPLSWFAWMIAAEAGLAALGLAWVYTRHARTGLAWNWPVGRTLIATGWPLACAGILTPLYTRLDQVLLDKYLGSHAVGIYAVAVRLSECWFIVPGTLVAAVIPLALEARLRSEVEFREKLQRLCNLLTWLGIAVGVGGTIAGPFLTRMLYGPEYAESGTILSVLCWSGVFVSWGLIRSAAITAQGDFGFALAYTFSGAVLNLTLNLVMIPRFGPIGAAIALLASHATCSTLLSVLHPPLRWTLEMQMRSLNPIKSFRDMLEWSKRP